jgi:hypothetical protein
MQTFIAPQGIDTPLVGQIVDGSGNPVVYTGMETLAGEVWAGDDQPDLFTFVPTWQTAGSGIWSGTIAGTHTTSLAPAIYRLRIKVNGADAQDAVLQVIWSPGTAAVRPTYVTIRDLRKEANWIEDLQNTEQHQAGFADECADSRDWLDENILRNYRAGFVSLLGYHGLALDSWFTGGNRRSQLTNYALRGWLAANLLMQTPRIKKVCTLYTLHQICKQQIGVGGKWPALAGMYRHQCNALLAGTTAEIDLAPQDGIPDIPIAFSAVNTLFT